MKILFLMLNSSSGPWDCLYRQGAESTWVKQLESKDIYLKYQGRRPSRVYRESAFSKLGNNKFNKQIWPYVETRNFLNREKIQVFRDSNSLVVDIVDRWSSISIKSLASFKFCLERFDFDYLVRSNASAYFNISQLKNFLSDNKPVYSGPTEKSKGFVMGWSIVMSRIGVEQLLRKFSWQDLSYFDDEAFGRVLTKSAPMAAMPFLSANTLSALHKANSDEIKKYPVIRTKIIDGLERRDYQAHKYIFEL